MEANDNMEPNSLLPGEVEPLNDIGRNALTVVSFQGCENNAELMVRGKRPEYLYNPATNKYDHYKNGVPGTEELGVAIDYSDIEKRAMDEFIRDYKQKHDGRFVTFDELRDRRVISFLKADFYTIVKFFIKAYNGRQDIGKEEKIKLGKVTTETLWLLIEATNDVRIMERKEGTTTAKALGYYHHTGSKAGTWDVEEGKKDADGKVSYRTIQAIGDLLGVKEKYYAPVVYSHIGGSAEPQTYGVDANLIPCANGVLDISNVQRTDISDTEWTATGFDFEPYLNDDGTENTRYTERYKDAGFTYKLATNWNPQAQDMTITGDDGFEWSAQKSFEAYTEDGQYKGAFVRALYETANACIRGTGLGQQNVILADGTRVGSGGGGKSTFEKMIAEVIGKYFVLFRNVDILCDTRFGLEGCDRTILAIFGNESQSSDDSKDDNGGIKDTARWKSLMRHEDITIDRKGFAIIETKIQAPFIQAVNGAIKIQANDEATWRGVIAIMFPHNFTIETDANGKPILDADGNPKKIERDYILTDYIKRPEIREFLLYKALSLGAISSYNETAFKEGTKRLASIRTERSTVYTYMTEWGRTVITDRHILELVYEHYRDIWCPKRGHRGCSYETFLRKVEAWIESTRPGWKLIETNLKGARLLTNTAKKKDAEEDGEEEATTGATKQIGEKYLGEIKRSPGRSSSINKYVGEEIDGIGYYKDEWVTKAKSQKRFTGAYLDRDGAETESSSPMTTEERDELAEMREMLKYYEYVNALLSYSNMQGYGINIKTPSKEEWIEEGRPDTDEAITRAQKRAEEYLAQKKATA